MSCHSYPVFINIFQPALLLDITTKMAPSLHPDFQMEEIWSNTLPEGSDEIQNLMNNALYSPAKYPQKRSSNDIYHLPEISFPSPKNIYSNSNSLPSLLLAQPSLSSPAIAHGQVTVIESPPATKNDTENQQSLSEENPVLKAEREAMDEAIGCKLKELQDFHRRMIELQGKFFPAACESEAGTEMEEEKTPTLINKSQEDLRTEDPAQMPETSGNSRAKRRLLFNPGAYYIPRPVLDNQKRVSLLSKQTFHYTIQGELDPCTRYTQEEMLDFLYGHELHGRFDDFIEMGIPASKASHLVLWIQNLPADSKHRYPTKASSRCRFADCLTPNGTIRNGEFRVCFDEWYYHEHSRRFDPYHNAGYVHLYCLEYFFDFPSICKDFNIQGDNRMLPEAENNRLAITRDNFELLDICNNFFRNSQSWIGSKDGDNNKGWYETTLSCALTKEHLKLQSGGRQRARTARQSANSIDKHLNNLHEKAAKAAKIVNQKKMEAKRHGGRKARVRKDKKRKAGEDEDENVLDSDPLGLEGVRYRKTKKPRIKC